MGYFNLVCLWLVLSLLSGFEGYVSIKIESNLLNEDVDEISDDRGRVTNSHTSDSLHNEESKTRYRREREHQIETIADIFTQEQMAGQRTCNCSERNNMRDCKDGKDGKDGCDGKDGRDGRDGRDGKDLRDNLINSIDIGTIYVRWGRSLCPSTSQLIYSGIAGGKHYTDQGSGTNYLCLPQDPEYDEYMPGVHEERAYVHSAEYQTYSTSSNPKHDHDVPCAVCRSSGRSSLLMIPAKMTCPRDWMKEYNGYLMAERSEHHHSSEFVCVDRSFEVREASGAEVYGALFYKAESRCTTNLPCGPYIDGAELACVVCSK